MTALGWIDPADCLADLGLAAVDDVLTRKIASAEQQVQDWREDITDWPAVKVNNPAVYDGGVRLACLYYQALVTPEGFAGFEEAGGAPLSEHAQVVAIRQLVRAHRPKVG